MKAIINTCCRSKSWLTIAVILAALTSGSAFAGTPELIFEAGSRAYLDGNWSEALDHWKQLERTGYENPELYFNLGNAYYKTGELGEAILFWEKAAAAHGEDEDIAANLEIARDLLEDRIDEPIRLPIWNKLDTVRAGFSTTLLTWFSVLFTLLIFVILSLKKWIWRVGLSSIVVRTSTSILIGLLVLDLLFLGLRIRDDGSHRDGILLIPEVDVLSAPAEGTGKLLFTLHEGTKVRIERQLEDWLEIQVGKDKQGWIRKGSIGVI